MAKRTLINQVKSSIKFHYNKYIYFNKINDLYIHMNVIFIVESIITNFYERLFNLNKCLEYNIHVTAILLVQY